jgi:uncharacterized protein (DUF1810 family)
MTSDLERFRKAQDGIHHGVIDELRRGRKTSHWMWLVFPQLAGLGRSEMSRKFAIGSLDEARALLADPILGARLRESVAATLAIPDRTAVEVFGEIDATKLRSSMTLFHRADPADPGFAEVLERFFGGVPDPLTDALLLGATGTPDR